MAEESTNPKVSLDNYEAIVQGMTFDQVTGILGEPNMMTDDHEANIEPGLYVSSLDTEVYEWRDGPRIIRVLFTDGTVNDKVSFHLE